jgi:Prenyltransferase and squalene oxidase repeat
MEIANAVLRQALERGIASLTALQDPDGSFAVKASIRRPPKHALDAIFTTSSVVVAVGRLLLGADVAAAVEFVAKRRRPDGLWGWEGCPSDADDAAMCMAALITAGALDASDASRLRQFWRAPSGPFRTWPEGFGNEKLPYDPVVNCNVLYCLTASGITVSDREKRAVAELVERAILSTRRYSEYYQSMTTLLYSAARARLPSQLLQRIFDCIRPDALDAQETAELLAASRCRDPGLLRRLLDSQRDDGTWLGTPWFFDVGGDFCSDAYATAVAVEALHRILVNVVPVIAEGSCGAEFFAP